MGMFQRSTATALVAGFAALAGGLVAQPAAAAESVADFYKGKTIQLIIGYSAGGGYDLYARTLAHHMGKHIPGNPNFVPQNMTGAGSRKAANWMYKVARKDGTVMATLGSNTPLDQALGEKGVEFDVRKFQWIGNLIDDNQITFSWRAAGLHTIDDVKKKGGLICGGTGASSPSITSPMLLNNLLDLKIRIISGYPGGSVINLAVERGEVNCRGSNTWSSQKATLGPWVRDQKFDALVQWGTRPNPEISAYQGKKVPLVTELAKNQLDRDAIRLVSSGLGRSFMVPQDVPAERVAALRKAFEDTLKDPAFLAETKKSKMDLNPMTGEEVADLAGSVVAASPEAIARANELVAIKGIEKVKK